MNAHPLTGKPLEQPDPPLRRAFAVFDADDPCTEHSGSYTGKIPCTGDYRCNLCGARWDEDGKYLGLTDADQMAQRGTEAWRDDLHAWQHGGEL